uniref:Retrotransposon protein, putative, Ty1-copia subclass n=1 Tax=Tanacetum cinerariifolium TaxID=118510 RepID=A0A6L2L1F0_TANCI|nr:retrotransposon protein, putative, Ty1-copia subclass [Tanacetum cinerariifolium]
MLESGFKTNECDNNDKMIKSTKDMLKSKFDMKDMGLAYVILGIKIIRTQNRLMLSQAHYVDKILNTYNARDSGQAKTLIDTSTRPDLAYAVSRLSRYMSNLSYAHWKAITRVLHYLRYNRDCGLHYDRHPAVIEEYSDANWISDIKDSRSTSEYVFTLGGAAISWMSSKLPGRRYVDGKVTHIDLVDMDEFSMYVFDKMVKSLHCDAKVVMFYHLKIPSSDLDRGILPLSSDEDVENLLRYVKNHKVIDVYIKTTLDTYIMRLQKSRVKIVYLDESESVELRKNMLNSRTTVTMDWNKNNEEVDVNDNLFIIGDTNDFIMDEEHIIDEPEVDMTNFRLHKSIEGGLGTQEIHIKP